MFSLKQIFKPNYIQNYSKGLTYVPKNYIHFPAPGFGHVAENVSTFLALK